MQTKKLELKNGHLRIRSAREEDAKTLRGWWNDGKVMAHAGFPNGLGISMEKVCELLQEDNQLNRRLIIELEGVPIGEMNYRTKGEKTAEIGIKLCEPSYRNRGYGPKYLRMMLQYIFMEMRYDKIILDTNLKNDRAQHVYEKLGFRKTKINTDAWRNQLGELQSSVEYEMLKEEYVRLFID